MFNALADVYSDLDEQGITVFSCPLCGSCSVASADGFIGLDTSRFETQTEEVTALIHEEGHFTSGAFYTPFSPYQVKAQAEYRADAESFRRYLPPNKIGAAMRAGYTEPWQLADYFDLDEDYIKKALHYWTECKAIRFDAEMGAE